jgi:SPP1 gp7 family putative phage head morphogenesis protein
MRPSNRHPFARRFPVHSPTRPRPVATPPPAPTTPTQKGFLDRAFVELSIPHLIKASRITNSTVLQEAALTKKIYEAFVAKSKVALGPRYDELFAPLLNPKNWVTSPDGSHLVKADVMGEFHTKADLLLGQAVADDVEADINKMVSAVYSGARSTTRSRLKLPATSLSRADADNVQRLADKGKFWVGNSYDAQTSQDIARITTQAINEGLGTTETAQLLRETLGERFAATDRYWSLIAGSSLEKSRTLGHLSTFQQARITSYEIVAIIDARTSEICQMMDGKVFKIQNGLERVDSYLEADNPNTAKQSWPWVSFDTEAARRGQDALFTKNPWTGARSYMPGSQFSPAPNDSWVPSEGAEVGIDTLTGLAVTLPPFHGNCRTTFIATQESLRVGT